MRIALDDLFANSAMARDYENRRESKQGEQVALKLNPFGDEWSRYKMALPLTSFHLKAQNTGE